MCLSHVQSTTRTQTHTESPTGQIRAIYMVTCTEDGHGRVWKATRDFMFIRETGGIVIVAVFHTRNRQREKKPRNYPFLFILIVIQFFFPCQIFEKEILVLFLQMRCELERLWWCKAWAVRAWFYSDFFKDTSMFCFVFFFITLYIY